MDFGEACEPHQEGIPMSLLILRRDMGIRIPYQPASHHPSHADIRPISLI